MWFLLRPSLDSVWSVRPSEERQKHLLRWKRTSRLETVQHHVKLHVIVCDEGENRSK